VLILFGVLLWRGCSIALRARDRFGTYLAFGITALLGFQAVINMGVVVGVLPTKGITLPFVSYGGTSLVACFFMVGILLSIARARPLEATAPETGWRRQPVRKTDRLARGSRAPRGAMVESSGGWRVATSQATVGPFALPQRPRSVRRIRGGERCGF
jgi:cell division protein FtsW